jgi:hypothetical protein
MAAHFDWEKAPAESRRAMWYWLAPALVVIGLLAVLMLAAYGISWLLFWPGYEERCPTWLSF